MELLKFYQGHNFEINCIMATDRKERSELCAPVVVELQLCSFLLIWKNNNVTFLQLSERTSVRYITYHSYIACNGLVIKQYLLVTFNDVIPIVCRSHPLSINASSTMLKIYLPNIKYTNHLILPCRLDIMNIEFKLININSIYK